MSRKIREILANWAGLKKPISKRKTIGNIMDREMRRVPANWEHPKDEKGHLIPLFGGSFSRRDADWDKKLTRWRRGYGLPCLANDKGMLTITDRTTGPFSDWEGGPPNEKDYMPDWQNTKRTHYQMYDSSGKGTPMSPVMESPEALAHWLADNNALANVLANVSYYQSYATATYDQWLAMIQDGSLVHCFIFEAGSGAIIST